MGKRSIVAALMVALCLALSAQAGEIVREGPPFKVVCHAGDEKIADDSVIRPTEREW